MFSATKASASSRVNGCDVRQEFSELGVVAVRQRVVDVVDLEGPKDQTFGSELGVQGHRRRKPTRRRLRGAALNQARP
jgi:hypothetical protein